MKPFPAILALLWCCLGPMLFAQPDTVIVAPPIEACPQPIQIPLYALVPQVILGPYVPDAIASRRFRRGDDHSIEYGLSTVPGLRFESRGPGGSRRVSMRGSLMRSGFGVRGIKAYVDDVPLTGPDGNTPLEVLDVAGLGDTRVLMGPQCALYGPGTGGVLQFRTADPLAYGRFGGTVSLGVGSFGYQRASVGLSLRIPDKTHGSETQLSALYVRERFVGYRAQEGNLKDFVLLKGSKQVLFGPKTLAISGSAWYYDGGWELPGALDSTTKADAPRSANAYSQNSAQAAVYRKWLQGNLRLSSSFGRYALISAFYGQWTHKLNPYGTSAFFNGYKDETGTGWGTRTSLSRIGRGNLQHTLHLELQAEPARLLEYENVQGQPGALLIDQRVLAYQGLLAAQTSLQKGRHRWIVEASLNRLATRFEDLRSQGTNITLPTPLMPQGRLEWNIRPKEKVIRDIHWASLLTFSAASSYSPPSWWELRRPDGSINTALQPEQGINLEGEFKLFHPREAQPRLDFRLYHHQLYRAILPYTLATGATEYRNAEACGQSGAELSYYLWIAEGLTLEGSAAWMHYRFLAQSPLSNFEEGDAVPGIPAYTGFLAAEYKLPFELRIRLSGQLTGPIWLDSRNTDRQPAFAVLNAYLEQTLTHFRQPRTDERRLTLRLNLGCNNLLNVQYSNYLNLNDQSRRYWNPAPGRNIFAGLHFTF